MTPSAPIRRASSRACATVCQSGEFTIGESASRPPDGTGLEQGGEAPPPLTERTPSQILPGGFEQVVGDEDHRHFGEDPPAEGLEADPPLHLRERQRRSVRPGQQLAVEHGALRQQGARLLDLGKPSA